MTQKRPSAKRVHTNASEAKRTNDLDTGIRLVIDGEPYEVRLADVSPTVARKFRAMVGGSPNKTLSMMSDDPDIDTFTDFVLLARLIRGEDVTVDDVSITYADLLSDGFTVETAGAEDVNAEDPES